MRLFAITALLAALVGASPAQTPTPGQPQLKPLIETITITAQPLGPQLDLRNGEAFRKTLFTRDDQIFHLLDAGINAGQHEGGGKSLEIRRFGFNLDHGGVNGGLRITVDNIPQNHGTQGHGQGYMGSLKSLSPELVDEVELINGPFNAEHGDFSGLGVVQIRLRESLPHQWTVRLQGGQYDSGRGFIGWSPNAAKADAFVAYEGSFTDGPFVKPLDYVRHNVTGNYTRVLDSRNRVGVKWNGGVNRFGSSGQIPLDEVAAGRLDRFGSLSPGDGGDIQQARLAGYFRKDSQQGATWKADGFIERSLFDLYSNFTFFLNDPVRGDGIQQHDSRLTQGADTQYARPQFFGWGDGVLTVGAGALATQNLVDLRQSVNRDPVGLFTSARANVLNGSGYVQENLNLAGGRVQLAGGLRWDVFRYAVNDLIDSQFTGAETSARLQPKASLAYSPFDKIPFKAFFNYGRAIASLDARGAVRRPQGPLIATTDFMQWGVQQSIGSRVSLFGDFFHINTSNQLVYIPDDGSLEFADPARSYGFEARLSAAITRKLSIDGGITKVLNAYYRGLPERIYLDSAPRFTANAALTLSEWRGWAGSLRMRGINSYRLDGIDPSIRAAGHVVFDMAFNGDVTDQIALNVAVDNLFDRDYWEVQNYFTSQVAGQGPAARIHGTPGYGRTLTAGVTLRFGAK